MQPNATHFMQGKTALITGATSGIGLVTARELARQGARVVLVGRNPAKTDAVVAKLRSDSGNPNVEAILADLSSQQQVRELAGQFQQRHARLDVLINNAGGIWLKRTLTPDGLEMTFAVNHLAYFLLTQLLLDTLRATPDARIVNVSSAAHRKAALDLSDLMGERSYGGWQQYCRTKLMNLLFTYELARRLAGTRVTVNALHPGWVFTGFGGSNGWKGWLLQAAARVFAIGKEEGARTVLYLASAPEVAGVSGKYYVQEKEAPSSAASMDVENAKRLWQRSVELCRCDPAS